MAHILTIKRHSARNVGLGLCKDKRMILDINGVYLSRNQKEEIAQMGDCPDCVGCSWHVLKQGE